MDITSKKIVLVLNKNWMVVNTTSIKEAIIGLASSSFKALDIDYENGSIGNPIMNPTSWEDWLELPVRPQDLDSLCGRSKSNASTNDNYCGKLPKMPFKSFSKNNPSKSSVGLRDGWRCQYSGKQLTRENSSVDHVLPLSRGGENSWENVVLSSKEINSKKGNRLNDEVGLKLLKKPRKPLPVPFCKLINEIKHDDWKLFINVDE